MASNLKHRVITDLQKDMPASGFLSEYLNWMRSENPRGSDTLEADIIETFTSKEGLRVLKLFEKAILYRPIPDGSEDRALRESNAVRNFVLEIRRIVSNGPDT